MPLPRPALYEAIAQLVPLLFLAAVFEARMYEPVRTGRRAQVMLLLSLGSALAAMMTTLAAALISIAEPTQTSTRWALAGLGGTLSCLLVGLLQPRTLDLTRGLRRRVGRLVELLVFAVCMSPVLVAVVGAERLAG